MSVRGQETSRFQRGDKVIMAGFPGIVVRLYSDGPNEGSRMYEVRMPRGLSCYCGSDLIPASAR